MAAPPIPTLMQLLGTEFDKKFEGIGLKTTKLFVEFCEDYLANTNPVVSTWFPGAGVGLTLADSTRVVTSRNAAPVSGATGRMTGQMQDSGAIEITKGEGLGEGTLPI